LNKKLRVAVIVFADAQILDIAGPVAVLAAANRLLPPNVGYEVTLASESVGPVLMNSPISLVVSASWADLSDADFDTLLVAGGMPGTVKALQSEPLSHLIRTAHESEKRIASICTGAFILAAAGILDNRKCTTHWQYLSQLRATFPSVKALDDVLFHVERNIWTSAGVTAGMDMTLAMVADDFGPEIALRIAKDLVMFVVRPGSLTQLSENLQMPVTQERKFRELMLWARANPAAKLDVVAMAERCNMSARNFTRRFREECGITPAKMVEDARVAAAQYYLENTELTFQRISTISGFPSKEAMGAAFKRRTGMLPSAYREMFEARASGGETPRRPALNTARGRKRQG
jgi:transcriptional regulator GlxA family with amidase domain